MTQNEIDMAISDLDPDLPWNRPTEPEIDRILADWHRDVREAFGLEAE